jgi:hypothetical protein
MNADPCGSGYGSETLVRGMDIRIRILPKMSWIRNTASNTSKHENS